MYSSPLLPASLATNRSPLLSKAMPNGLALKSCRLDRRRCRRRGHRPRGRVETLPLPPPHQIARVRRTPPRLERKGGHWPPRTPARRTNRIATSSVQHRGLHSVRTLVEPRPRLEGPHGNDGPMWPPPWTFFIRPARERPPTLEFLGLSRPLACTRSASGGIAVRLKR